MESFHSRLKDEAKDFFLEASNIWELKRIVRERIQYYNQGRGHLVLEYLSPINYLKREKVLPQEPKTSAKISV
ncbi:MAG: IS3 family transposase [Candidatus Bipolaricaulota bacterium]